QEKTEGPCLPKMPKADHYDHIAESPPFSECVAEKLFGDAQDEGKFIDLPGMNCRMIHGKAQLPSRKEPCQKYSKAGKCDLSHKFAVKIMPFLPETDPFQTCPATSKYKAVQ